MLAGIRFRTFIACIAIVVVAVYLARVRISSSTSLQATRKTAFHSEIQDGTSLRYVANSGICETTPGVAQYSGYIDIGTNMSMWFWFFEARNSPETAPFTLWLNGGPGCSSMIGLLQENGPCWVNADGASTSLNPYSWNTVSNMIYIDQPIGTGFSYGTDTVNDTEAAAPFVWKAFQILFESQVFSKYASREFILATESYGGHYGPSFVTYFEQQNDLIARGKIVGEPIAVSGMAINNGWYDPLIQFMSYYDFAKNAPGYGQLQSDDVLANISADLYGPDGCVAREQLCYAAGDSAESDDICGQADSFCNSKVMVPAAGYRDPNDLRQFFPAWFPPKYFLSYLNNSDVTNRIGAETVFQEYSETAAIMFVNTGDDARTLLPRLSKLADSKMNILIWAGDADINCNWLGNYACVRAMEWYGKERLSNTPLSEITFYGTPIAEVANVDNFSFAVFGAGHEVSAFQPAAALQIFTQFINKEPLHSVIW